MGARGYIPIIGRFTSIDPIEGGVENGYVYPPDPVGDFDLDGTATNMGIVSGVGISDGAVANKVCGANLGCRVRMAAQNAALRAAVGLGSLGAVGGARAAWAGRHILQAGARGKVTGYTRHALGRMAGTRGGPQMSPQAVRYIVKNGVRGYDAARKTYSYSHQAGKVILNYGGKVVTAISRSRYTRFMR